MRDLFIILFIFSVTSITHANANDSLNANFNPINAVVNDASAELDCKLATTVSSDVVEGQKPGFLSQGEAQNISFNIKTPEIGPPNPNNYFVGLSDISNGDEALANIINDDSKISVNSIYKLRALSVSDTKFRTSKLLNQELGSFNSCINASKLKDVGGAELQKQAVVRFKSEQLLSSKRMSRLKTLIDQRLQKYSGMYNLSDLNQSIQGEPKYKAADLEVSANEYRKALAFSCVYWKAHKEIMSYSNDVIVSTSPNVTHWNKVKNASCDGTQAGLATKAANFIKKNKYVIGGAAGLAYLVDRDERKQKNKLKRAEEAKLNTEIEACSDVNKAGGPQCAQLFAEKCLTDSSERGCAEYTSALCEEPGSSGNPVGINRPYCVLKNSQKFCSGDSATSNGTSPACQWVNNLPEECTENPAAPQCFARFENQHVFAAVCNQNKVDPLCTHVTAPSPGQKLIVFGPATNFNGGANIGVVVSNQGRAPSSGVFGDITQTSSVATAPAADVASADTSLFSSSSVSEACLNEQLTNCGI